MFWLYHWLSMSFFLVIECREDMFRRVGFNSLPTTPIIALHHVTVKVKDTGLFPSCFFAIAGSFAVIWTCGTMWNIANLCWTFIKRSNFSFSYFIRLFYMWFVIT